MSRKNPSDQTLLFPSALGWMGVILKGNRIRQLTFGHASSAGAWRCLDPSLRIRPKADGASPRLVARLQAYARGKTEDFSGLAVDLQGCTAFQRRVYGACRRIASGSTRSYGELAAQLGSPRAARAVGTCMARNQIPLVIPCHRVVYSNGRIGPYSAPGGKLMKKRLLELEKSHP
jgi:methylated-DNA-[protein]-cysteine S-methyltransferase